ncbi:MAG: CRISPR-associated helicase Cas3', partial [Endomicrobiales bacterium]|nr:CRISPR-associated helicase Cas3' [Endomicrobiales bacterium]
SKRGLLAPFAVGTIDQALMAVMNVKHGFVRTFGLAGKVVILDEVHSYDSYTGTILKELVTALRALHCTVIILSATLTNEQRYSIMGISSIKLQTENEVHPYPLISAYPNNGILDEIETEQLPKSQVMIRISPNDDEAVNEVINRAQRGEQVLWIENTVFEAQERYCRLAAIAKENGIGYGLMHSRFLKVDRQKNEDTWVNIYGKAGHALRNKQGRILIGTQVLEQSLDIDADFLLTRLCPTDMLFQRVGRLWRHRENDAIRPVEAQREAWILAPVFVDAVQRETAFGKSSKVYDPYILCRTLEVWQNVLSVCLPNDIRSLIEATYIKRNETGNMKIYETKMEEQRDKLSRFALIGVSQGGKTLPESKASTRYSQIPTVNVLLIRAYRSDVGVIRLQLLNGSELILTKRADAHSRRKVASQLLMNTVVVPEYIAPVTGRKQISWLSDYVYLGDELESPFRAAIVMESGELKGIGATVISEKYELYYDKCLGYRAKKKGRSDYDGE